MNTQGALTSCLLLVNFPTAPSGTITPKLVLFGVFVYLQPRERPQIKVLLSFYSIFNLFRSEAEAYCVMGQVQGKYRLFLKKMANPGLFLFIFVF